ncbi:MAG: hypothetical protein ACFE9L_15775 [Candidatus Hodarchaeota archaeon]
MKRLTKKLAEKTGKEALNVTTRTVGSVAADIAKESLIEGLEKSNVTDTVKRTVQKATKRIKAR